MGTYDPYNDTPQRIQIEGETITLTLQQGIPSVGQGTVTWNIPDPGTDNVSGSQGAYAGIIIVASDQPLNAHNLPRNGAIYQADPTVNRKLHTGDKIGNAMVVGAFYERLKVGQGKTLTTSLILNDLKDKVPYYVGAFAMDSEFRYHTAGIRAYSDQLTGHQGTSLAARQMVKIGNPNQRHPLPVHPSAGTGLIPRQIYQFDVLLDHHYPYRPGGQQFRISLDGLNAATYGDLICELNKQFALVGCPPSAPVSPDTNQLYWDAVNQKLYQLTYDPATLVLTLTPITNVIIDATDPTQVAAGTYWYNPTTGMLFIRVGTSPGAWQQVTIINYGTVNPTALTCDDYWIQNGTSPIEGFQWNGSAWCSVPVINSAIDPACPPTNLCGAYWFDSTTSTLYRYDVDTKTWIASSAIVWPSPPNQLPVGTYWFDLVTNTLNIRAATSPLHWTTLSNVFITTTQPTTPAAMSYWYNPATEVLQQFNGSTWVLLQVLVWPGDPTIVSSCDLWWNHATSPGTLNVWDVVNNKWTPVAEFFDQPTDPSLAPTVAVGTLWYNSTTKVTLRWDGSSWNPISVVLNPYDPTQPHTGDAWFNPVNNTFYVWNSSAWVAINPIISSNDPTMLPVGTYWYDTTNNSLWQWNGTQWVSVAFTTTVPFPPKGQVWFNTTDNKLYRWDGDKWCLIPPIIHSFLDHRGYVGFESREKGSGMHLKILIPGGSQSIGTGHGDPEDVTIPSGGIYDLDPSLNDPFIPEEVPQPVSTISEDAYLFNHLIQGARLMAEVIGADGVADIPSYLEIGVGTDGTPDERRQLADTIRRQLGFPAVEVELDKKQMNDCISFALQQFRQKSSLSYKRAFFFLDIAHRKQKYILSNRQLGYHKIVNVTACHRFTSAFLATANGSGVYGQVVLQHLYNMGTYDLTSYFLVSNYIETMELLFATRLTYSFDESSRLLHLYNTFSINERVLMDCTVEKTEQEILRHRLSVAWIREWAMAEAMLILSQIRGKYASLPGAGGGVSLNASELRDRAEKMQEKLLGELDDYQAQDVESLGYNTQFVIG